MVSKARSKNMKERMAYVRSFRRKKKGGKIKASKAIGEAMVVGPWGVLNPSERIARKVLTRKKGGRFPKGGLSYWKAHANEPKYKKAIANWNKMMANNKFASSWNANKKKVAARHRGGALTTVKPLDYSQLMHQYDRYPLENVGLKGGAIRGFGFKDVINSIRSIVSGRRSIHNAAKAVRKGRGIRAAGIRAAGIRAAGIRAAGHHKHRKGAGIRRPTKKDLYKGGGNGTGVFYSKVKTERRKVKPVASNPETDLVNGYRELYKNSGITRQTPVFFDYKRTIPPNVVPMRPHKMNIRKITAAGGRFIKGGRFMSGGNFLGKVFKSAASTAKASLRGLKRVGKKIIGRGLTEEAGLNGKGHPDYIYH